MDTFNFVLKKMSEMFDILRNTKTPWGMSWFSLFFGFVAIAMLISLFHMVTNQVPSYYSRLKGIASSNGDRIRPYRREKYSLKSYKDKSGNTKFLVNKR